MIDDGLPKKTPIKVGRLFEIFCSTQSSMFKKLLKYKPAKDFLRESTMHGFRLLLHDTPYKHARIIWTAFMIGVIIWTQFTITSLSIQYTQKPTQVRMSTHQAHVSNANFPGVAVCSANKLSRSKVMAFAKVTDKLNSTLVEQLDEIFTFMFNTTDYPVRDVLKNLAPDCEGLIIRGTIYGNAINTSDFFLKRMTSSSVCCMFNYNRKSYSANSKREYSNFTNKANHLKFESSTILNSVQFVLRSEWKDFTITEFHNSAFQLTIFPSEEYATIQSNRIGEILVDYGTIVEVPIEPQFFGSTQQVRHFAPEVRNCYFPDEGQKLLNQSFYSIDECLLLCLMDSMNKYCGCVTPPLPGTDRNFTSCTFFHLPCLANWKGVWYGWDYFEYVNIKDVQDISPTGRRCSKCLPTCNGVDFNLEVNVKTLHPHYGPNYSEGILDGLNNSKPLAVVKLFFKQDNLLYTEMDIVGDWVVLLNRFGGIMSLMYGFSIVSFIEIVYFVTGKFFVLHFEKWKLTVKRKLAGITKAKAKSAVIVEEEEPPPAYTLYWKELRPQQPPDMEIFKHNVIKLYERDKN